MGKRVTIKLETEASKRSSKILFYTPAGNWSHGRAPSRAISCAGKEEVAWLGRAHLHARITGSKRGRAEREIVSTGQRKYGLNTTITLGVLPRSVAPRPPSPPLDGTSSTR